MFREKGEGETHATHTQRTTHARFHGRRRSVVEYRLLCSLSLSFVFFCFSRLINREKQREILGDAWLMR